MVKRITAVCIKLVGSKKGVTILSEFNRRKFLWQLTLLSAGLLMVFFQSPGFCGDIENKLSSADGSTTFEVRDSGDSVVSHIDSDGNMVIKGGLRLDSAGAECTTSENLIVDGNVGVGTTTIGAKLHVESDSTVFIASNTTNGYGLVVSPNGYVGIGTDSPATPLEINAPGPLSYTHVQACKGTDAALYAHASDSSITSTLEISHANPTGYSIYSHGGLNYLKGNVGIGDIPYGGDTRLLLTGNVLFRGDCTIKVEKRWINNPGWDLKIAAGAGNLDIGGNLYLYGGAGGFTDDGNVILAHNGSTSQGNVGVGTTTIGAKLHVESNSTVFIASNTTNGYGLVVSPNGYVGIGTDSPATPLEIRAPGPLSFTQVQACKGTDSALYTIATHSSINSALRTKHANPTGFSIYSDGGTHYFKDEVGIGMTPYTGGNTKLYISGDVLFHGNHIIEVEKPMINGRGNDLKISAADGNLDIGGNLYLYGGAGGFTDDGNVILAHNSSTSQGNVGIGTTSVGAKLHVVSDSTDSAVFIASHTTNGYGLVVSTNGYVGIGTNTPSGTLHVNAANGIYIDNLASSNQASVEIDLATGKLSYIGSSIRYKKDIRDLKINSEDVFKLRPVRFKWKKTDEEDIGLIAEEVNEVIPELVRYDKKGKPATVEYELISVYLLEVVNQQQQKISALEQRIAEIEKKLKKI